MMTHAAMANRNVVVAPAADPSRNFSNYASKSSFILGLTQIGVGVVISLIGILAIFGTDRVMSGVVTHLVFGVIFVVAGSLGIHAGKVKTMGPIVGFMVLSIIGSIYAVYAFISFVVAGVVIIVLLRDETPVTVFIIIAYVCIALYLVESVASIWSAVICCRSVCCGRRQTPGIVIGYAAPSGQVVVNAEQMPLQLQQQPGQGVPYQAYAGQATAPPSDCQVSNADLPPKY